MKKINESTCTILNIQVDNLSMNEAISQIYHGFIVTLNVDHLIHLQKDEEFFNVYESADYRFCDSQILMKMSRFLGTPIKEKITGSDFFPRFCQFHRSNTDIRVFLLGGASDSPDLAAKNINTRLGYPVIVGGYSPPFGFENDPYECTRIIALIKESGATVLAVGVGAPKQEKWIKFLWALERRSTLKRETCFVLHTGLRKWAWNGSIASFLNPDGCGDAISLMILPSFG
jgi:N-acetylglucosaminyldiphosphoundecaprenol N-acetyl-beta-D-mannosaminyltransferase